MPITTFYSENGSEFDEFSHISFQTCNWPRDTNCILRDLPEDNDVEGSGEEAFDWLSDNADKASDGELIIYYEIFRHFGTGRGSLDSTNREINSQQYEQVLLVWAVPV